MTISQRLFFILMTSVASSLLAASLLDLSSSPSHLDSQYEVQFSENATHDSSNDSDYLSLQVSQASNFSHLKQQPQTDSSELISKKWLDLSSSEHLVLTLVLPSPWYTTSGKKRRSKLSGWKVTNLNFKRHLYIS